MNRLPIRELINTKPKPILTPSLVPALRTNAEQMIETYIFTDSIRGYFEIIFDSVARGSGQGFWIQAEYGAGKTHFLITLAALLSDTGSEVLWNGVQDAEVQQIQSRLTSNRLFPVVLSLRGEGASDSFLDRSLMDVLLENFQDALTYADLDDKIRVTSAQDIVNWLETRTTPAIRQEVEDFVLSHTGQSFQDYKGNEGVTPLAALISEYFEEAGIRPGDIAVGVKDRIAYIYEQLTDPHGPGYNGLLIVIDEYEGWEKSHNTPEEKGRDADLLETLGFILPRDLGYSVYTVVASQSSVPAKLMGSGEGDRFVPIPLLAQENQRDYDVIISRRTRDLDESLMPEIKDYFRYYSEQFDFARNLEEVEFQDVFPFQPRCFEAVRRITARELPTARSGLLVFWEVINNPELTSGSDLIRLTDMISSPHLIGECLTKSIYKESYNAYTLARDAIDMIGLEPEDLPLANDLLNTLYLWHVAFLDAPQPMSLKELVEATLTTQTSDGIRAHDAVAIVLDSLQALPQVQFDNDSARFIPAGGEGPSILTTFNEYKRRAIKKVHELQSKITDSLFFTPSDTGGSPGLFSEFNLDNPLTKRVESRRLEYAGEVIVSSGWRIDQGLELPKEDIHFRLVILTPHAVKSVNPSDLQDSRIAVILPGEFTDEVKEVAAAHIAWHNLDSEYRNESGRYADEVKSWLDAQKTKVYTDLVSTHLKLYQTGKVVTRDGLAITARDSFGQGGNNDNRIAYIVERLLINAYKSLPIDPDRLQRRTLKTSDIGKIFDGYFSKNPKTADSNATRNFGVPLELSHADTPNRFAPQDLPTFKIIGEMINIRNGDDLPIWEVYDNLSRSPYGLPYSLIQLFLLAFVRHRHPRVEITLKPRHGLTNRSNQPFPRDRLTASNVVDLNWKTHLEDKFDALVPGIGPSWNDSLDYARLIVDDLRQSTDQADIEAQSHHLSNALQILGQNLATLSQNLDNLAGTLSTSLPADTKQTLDDLTQLIDPPIERFSDLFERSEEVFEHNPESLRDAIATYHRLQDLGNQAAEIIQVKRYLDEITPRFDNQQLTASRNTLRGNMRIEMLIGDPDSWPRLRSDFRNFQKLYTNEYHKHHRDYYSKTNQINKTLLDANRHLQALQLLNGIDDLGRIVGKELQSKYQEIITNIKTCSVSEVAAVNVEYTPTCDQCGLSLADFPLENEVNNLMIDLEEALNFKCQQLADEAVGHVIREGKTPQLNSLLEAVQTANLEGLVVSINEEVADWIRKELSKRGIHTFDAEILDDLIKRNPTIEEDEIPIIVAQFETLLKDAFSKAREKQPDKKTYRLNLK